MKRVDRLETVFVAEGMGGLSIWRGKRKLERIGRYREPGQSVKQVTVEPRGRFALLHVGLNRLQIVDVANPAAPRKVLEEGYLGLFYRRSITLTAGAPGGLVSWGHDGLFLYDVSKDDAPRAAAWRYPFGISARGGAVRYRDGWLVTSGGSYFLLRPGETRSPQQVGLIGIKGRGLWGKPALGGDTLFLSDSEGGKVTAVDISTLTAPRVIAEIEVPEHPGFVVGHKGVALVPGGYQGLLVWRYRGGA